MTRLAPAAAVAALALLAATPAAAHEVRHEVQRGRAIAVRATYADGEPLAYCEAEVYAPADGKIPWQKGRTDREGWVAFVPGRPGTWRVRVVDSTGHGLVAEVGVDAADRAAAPAAEAPGARRALAPVLRPLLAVAVIGAVFAALSWRARRRAGR
jgi:nickel transport protein